MPIDLQADSAEIKCKFVRLNRGPWNILPISETCKCRERRRSGRSVGNLACLNGLITAIYRGLNPASLKGPTGALRRRVPAPLALPAILVNVVSTPFMGFSGAYLSLCCSIAATVPISPHVWCICDTFDAFVYNLSLFSHTFLHVSDIMPPDRAFSARMPETNLFLGAYTPRFVQGTNPVGPYR